MAAAVADSLAVVDHPDSRVAVAVVDRAVGKAVDTAALAVDKTVVGVA